MKSPALAWPLICLLLAACTAASPTGNASAPASVAASASVEEPTPTADPTSPEIGWHLVEAAGPLPDAREDHTLTVTPDGSTAYLFGGRTADGRSLADLWSLDLATDTWSRVTGDGPPARFGHNAAWVESVGLVIFAGQSEAAFYNDLWAYDPAADAWSQLPSGGDAPVARYGSCAAVGPDGRLWISHGFTSDGSRFADTRAYDFSTQTWTDETPAAERPVERCLHSCWWTDNGAAFVLYAGQTTGVFALGDLWQLIPGPRPGTNSWSMIGPGERWPPDRQLPATARWGAATLVFGGRGLDGTYLADAWLIDDAGLAERLRLEGPAARAGAELIADPVRGRMLLFGGRDADLAMNDLWAVELPTR